MTIHDSNSIIKKESSNFIHLELSKKLQDEEIIKSFVKDIKTNCIKLEFNHKYEDSNVVLPINRNNWLKFLESVEKRIKEKGIGINDEHIRLIKNALDDNHEIILGIININEEVKQNNDSENNNDKNQSEKQKQLEEEKKEDNIIPLLSVSQTIRKNSGDVKVKGTIIGVSKLFKMISNVSLYCEKCQITTERDFNPIPVSDTKSINQRCEVCDKSIRHYNIEPIDHKNTVIIELQDINSFDDLDRLSVFLFDEDTIGIKVGENVEITGNIKIIENKFKYFPYLYGESIQYLNRENFMLTKSDIEKIKEFKETYQKENSGIINQLVSLFDPSIVECEFEKEGILVCAVNTSTKIGDKSEHLDELFIGPPGLAKSKLLKRATELVPGSNRAGGQYSTGKSLTAIIDKTDDNTFLRLGSIPKSRDAICAINELSKLSHDDLDKLYDVMEEREFPFDKYGIHTNIQTPTAIIASANPTNKDSWLNNEKVDFNELPFLAPLKDRFDLIFILHYKQEQKERDEFADKLSEVETKKEKEELPDHTEFLIKYIQYAKQINPILTDEAWFMLTEFYKKVNAKGFGSPRVLKTLKKLSKAIARLKLKNVVDEEDAKETMEFYNTMLVKFQKSVIYSESPKFLAYKKGVEIVKRYKNFYGITLEQIFETICKEDKQLATFFGYDNEKSLKIKDNHKTRDVKNLLLGHSNIKIIGEKPLLLKWLDSTSSPPSNLSDASDVCDKEKISNQEKNNKNNIEKNNENELEPTSHTAHTSLSEQQQEEEITKFKLRLSEKSKCSYDLTREQHDFLIENNDDNREQYNE